MNEGPGIPSGIWHSVYTYESSGQGEQADERDVKLHLSGSGALIVSLPGDPSKLEVYLVVSGRTLNGAWRERTDPDGQYGGATFSGAVQFILGEDGRSMSGQRVDLSRDMSGVDTGTWTLTFRSLR
jgi:hypothetical protein